MILISSDMMPNINLFDSKYIFNQMTEQIVHKTVTYKKTEFDVHGFKETVLKNLNRALKKPKNCEEKPFLCQISADYNKII